MSRDDGPALGGAPGQETGVKRSLAGRVAVVTGASSGIGLATATIWGCGWPARFRS